MFKSATSYKAALYVALAFFFGLTLGLTLNVVGSQTFENRTRAESPGNQKNVYCRLTRDDLNDVPGVTNEYGTQGWRICNGNPGENGWLGQDDIDDNNPNDGTNNRTSIAIGSNVVLQYLSGPNGAVTNTNRTPQDTRCSVVQHDGLDSADDVWVQYSADANNYCVIHYTPSRQNYCVQNGVRINVENPNQEADKPGSPLNNWIKGQFDQKCQPPSPTPVKPTASMNTRCTPNQATGATNLSYEMRLTNIVTPGGFQRNQWMMCFDKTTTNGSKVFNQFFKVGNITGKSWWSNAQYACYRVGEDNTYLNPNNNFMWMRLGHQVTNDGVASTNKLYTRTGNTVDAITFKFSDLATWNENNGTKDMTFLLKTNLWSNNGGFNDQINSTYLSPIPAGGIKINPSACIQPTSTPAPTNTPTQTPSPSPVACTWTTLVNTPSNGDYLFSGAIVKTVDNFILNENDNKIDKSKGLKIAVDWGWTGGNGQKGPVDVVSPILEGEDGDEIIAEDKHQTNETSKAYIKYYTNSNTTAYLNNSLINCPDVGEWKTAGSFATPFSDGRTVIYNGITTYLQDPLIPQSGGRWYTCPLTASVKPVESTNTTKVWKTTSALPSTALNKIQIVREYTGGNNGTSNNKLKGSHYSRVSIQYCKLP